MDEGGVEVARRYTSLAREEANETKNYARKQTGEVGGTGTGESPPVSESKMKERGHADE